MTYKIYREMVLAKANGQDIHDINQLLGQILNGGPNIAFFKSKGMVFDENRAREIAETAMCELGIKTGVKYTLNDLTF